MRKMATIRKVGEISPIENADAIEVVKIDGWSVVVKKGEFATGDMVVYCEIDSWIPTELAPFLSKGNTPREWLGIKGERLRTIKLRGQISQGLVLPLYDFPPTAAAMQAFHSTRVYDPDELYFDVTELLGIVKFEPDAGASLGGIARGNFPAWMRKTDQERIQNMFKYLTRENEDGECDLDRRWIAEEKLDGSSMTVGVLDGDVHVCSRNLSINIEDDGNAFVAAAKESGIIPALIAYGENIALSGELCGPGIQGNKYNLVKKTWFIFDIFDVTKGEYLTVGEREKVIVKLCDLGAKFCTVPEIAQRTLTGESLDSLLKMAEGKSVLNPKAEREGLVWKRTTDGNVSFKAISNRFLLKHDE